MAKVSLLAGTTSYIATVFVQDSASTTGAGKTGLAFNTASLTAYYVRPAAAAAAITLATQTTTGAYSSGGFVEIDATNMPGFYRLDVPNAVLAAGAKSAAICMKGASGMAPLTLEFELTAVDNQDSVRMGMTALPNAAAGGVGGVPLGVDASGRVDVLKINGTSQTARDIGASVLLSAGTGTGQLDFTSGVVKANLAQILGTALTETAGQIAGAFKKWFDVATPTGTVNSIPNATAGAAGGIFIAGTNAATTITTALTTTFTGNLTGSVGNVTGSVGSVIADCGITQAGADKVFGASGAAMSELTGVPSATPSPRNALMLLFMAMRNKLTTTSSAKTLFNDAGSSITSKSLTDDGTTYTEAKMV